MRGRRAGSTPVFAVLQSSIDALDSFHEIWRYDAESYGAGGEGRRNGPCPTLSRPATFNGWHYTGGKRGSGTAGFVGTTCENGRARHWPRHGLVIPQFLRRGPAVNQPSSPIRHIGTVNLFCPLA
jgi:hypothetical protein